MARCLSRASPDGDGRYYAAVNSGSCQTYRYVAERAEKWRYAAMFWREMPDRVAGREQSAMGGYVIVTVRR